MNEEQPIFKVTDRRLFNADGSPREIEREEEATAAGETNTDSAPASASSATASATSAQTATQSAAAAPAASSTQQESDAHASGATGTTAASGAHAEQLPEDVYAEGDLPGADDPASFVNFLMSIASNAAAALGMMEHPVTGQRSVDPELGKHWIDILGMLKEKTRGNLAPQEQQIFEGLLADLRMQYVSLTSARQPNAPRGFTGSDITGGK
ncbi:MAG: hypothetical protein QOC96_132 [Acidobacteriota bacterium]|jgi:hypothetical protein|nr:hypothetical protein [Acidobacteriota bacterium]